MAADKETKETMVNRYPIALDLRGRRCVIVGGGVVAARKAEGLLGADAAVVIVAPDLGEKARELVAAGRVEHVAAPFLPVYLDGAFLAIAATDNGDVNRVVGEAARARGVLLNLAGALPADATAVGSAAGAGDDSEGGDFVTMATIRRGELLVGLTTGGAGPALATRLRREFDTRFGPEWAAYVSLLREMRDLAKAQLSENSTARTAALRRLAEADGVRVALRGGDAEGARREAMSCLF